MNRFNKSLTYIYKIEYYNDNCERIIKLPLRLNSVRSTIDKFNIKRDKEDRINVEKLKSSISRSKRNIRRICLSNDFEFFATWTINSDYADRFSVQDAQDKMRKLLEQYKKQYKLFRYIYVMEKHKDGAIHFHGLVKGVPFYNEIYKNYKFKNYLLKEFKEDEFDKLPYHILDTIRKGMKIYYIPFFNDNLGYCTFSPIKNYNACCNYIIKYITKDPIRNENDQIYFCSRGLRKCVSEIYLTDIDDKYFDGGFEYKQKILNENTLKEEEILVCKVKDIYIDNFNHNKKIDYILDTNDRYKFLY